MLTSITRVSLDQLIKEGTETERESDPNEDECNYYLQIRNGQRGNSGDKKSFQQRNVVTLRN